MYHGIKISKMFGNLNANKNLRTIDTIILYIYINIIIFIIIIIIIYLAVFSPFFRLRMSILCIY